MARKNKTSNKFNSICIIVILLVFSGTMMFKMVETNQKNYDYKSEEERLKAEISEQEAKKEQLAELEEEMKTLKYVEKVAREKLGLMYPDEIIFRQDDNN